MINKEKMDGRLRFYFDIKMIEGKEICLIVG